MIGRNVERLEGCLSDELGSKYFAIYGVKSMSKYRVVAFFCEVV